MVGVVLKQQMTELGIAEVGIVAVFAVGNKSIPFLVFSFVFKYSSQIFIFSIRIADNTE